jgi:glutamyl-Q tRNA(Asp) synthetase
MRVSLTDTTVKDEIQGLLVGSTWGSMKNIAIWRRDGIPSYPLSVIVDDSVMGVSHIVRGSDLAEYTVLQAYLLDMLGLGRPHYAHIPVIVDRKGEKLSKRDEATTVDNRHSTQNVMWTMQLLGMNPPQHMSLADLLKWGIDHWSLQRVPSEVSLSSVVSI